MIERKFRNRNVLAVRTVGLIGLGAGELAMMMMRWQTRRDNSTRRREDYKAVNLLRGLLFGLDRGLLARHLGLDRRRGRGRSSSGGGTRLLRGVRVAHDLGLPQPELTRVLARRARGTTGVRTARRTVLALQIELRAQLVTFAAANEALQAEEVRQVEEETAATAPGVRVSRSTVKLLARVAKQPAPTPVAP